jgi:acetate kinase
VSTAVLVLNCGSSSVKFALIDPASGTRHLTGLAERVGTPEASISLKIAGEEGSRQLGGITFTDHRGIIQRILTGLHAWLTQNGVEISAVGHRLVHGGEAFSSSVVLDDATMDAVKACIPLAPLHNPANIAGVEAAYAMLPDVPQVGVFDTAFHQSMPEVAFQYAVPRDWYTEYGVRRYGFHGTSHLYVSTTAAEMLGRPVEELRIVTAHLGNGCSLAAVKNGISVDTSMGMTPLEGVVMGTRSGDLDPGIIAYMAERTGQDAAGITDILNKRSGLLGLSNLSNDMRELQSAAREGNASARLALDVFVYRLTKYVASLVVPLEGIDVLVFTGGIGENDAVVRASVVNKLGFLGFALDADANAAAVRGRGGPITTSGPGSAAGGPVALVVPTDEELVIARDAQRLSTAVSE